MLSLFCLLFYICLLKCVSWRNMTSICGVIIVWVISVVFIHKEQRDLCKVSQKTSLPPHSTFLLSDIFSSQTFIASLANLSCVVKISTIMKYLQPRQRENQENCLKDTQTKKAVLLGNGKYAIHEVSTWQKTVKIWCKSSSEYWYSKPLVMTRGEIYRCLDLEFKC